MKGVDFKPAGRFALAVCATALLTVPLGACGGRSSEPSFAVDVMVLKEARSAGVTDVEIPVISGSRQSVLAVPIPGHMGAAALEVRVLDDESKVVWVGVGLRRNESGNGLLLVPPGFLPPGDYTLQIGRALPDVGRGRFPIRVK